MSSKTQQQQQHTAPVSNSKPAAPAKAAKLVPFLRKVQVLCDTCPPHIARWSADGKQFDVLDPKGFEELLKVHFEGASPATFHRQLFFYGWVKLNYSNGGGDERTKGTWSFRHPSFLRDEPSRIYEIKRYARASDREEQEDGSRVDILERRVSALQSLVDDLSRKLAAVQMTLERTPLPPVVAASEPLIEKPGRKRMKDIDEDFLSDEFRLSEDEILGLFEDAPQADFDEPATPAVSTAASPMVGPVAVPHTMEIAPPKQQTISSQVPKMANLAPNEAQQFLTSFMSTPQFQAALTSTIQENNASNAAAAAKKVESLPHLSVC